MGQVVDTGIEAAGVNSAYIRSVGYAGFESSSVSGIGGFAIFSGSVSASFKTTESYDGVGLELHDGSSGSFRFRTLTPDGTSELDIKTNKFFFGREGVQFISGSDDKIEISSSNFHLDNDGSVTMQGTITATAGGTIGGFDIGGSTLSVGTGANFIALDSSNKKLRIGEKATLTDSNAGVHIGTDGIALGASSALKMTNTGQITGSQVLFSGGTIGGFTVNGGAGQSSLIGKTSDPAERFRLDLLSGELQVEGNDGFGITLGGDASSGYEATTGTSIPIVLATEEDASRTVVRFGDANQFIKFDRKITYDR